MARFSDRQFALGQFSLSFGTTVKTIRKLIDDCDRLKQDQSPPDSDQQKSLAERTLQEPRFFQMAGPCDVIVQLEPTSFRRLPEVADFLMPENLSAQWTLGKEVYADPAFADTNERECPSREDPLAFVIFLRIDREVYRRGGAEADHALIQGIEDALRERVCQARILAGLGWADYILSGHAIAGRDGMTEILKSLLQLHYQGVAALQRSISLVGYEWTNHQPPAHDEPIPGYGLKIRLRPHSVGRVHDELEGFFRSLCVDPVEEKDILLSYTGGKRDVILIPKKRGIRMKNLMLDEGFRRTWRTVAARASVEHVETNFLINHWTPAADEPEPVSREQPRASQNMPCRYRQGLRFKADLGSLKDRIPDGILQSLHGIYALFRAALNDPYKRCDISTAIRSCDGVLSEVLQELGWLWGDDSPYKPLEPEAAFLWRARLYDALMIWCSRAEKVINERSAGSFDNKLVPSPALSPYRGHVNKILVTADMLVREFVTRVSKFLLSSQNGPEPCVEPPAFHLGATDQIVSDLRAGVVTLPSRYMFSLALAIPQLWSEAGVRIFNRVYQYPFDRVVGDRVRPYLEADARYRAPYTAETHSEDEDRISQSKESVIAELADHYADLVVRFFGLESDFAFSTYLVSLYTSAFHLRAESIPEEMVQRRHQELLQRLLLVQETSLIVQTYPGNTSTSARDHDNLEPFFRECYWRNGEETLPLGQQVERCRQRVGSDDIERRRVVLEHLTEKIDHQVGAKREPPGADSVQADWPWPDFTLEIKNAALEWMLSEAYFTCHWQFMWDFIGNILEAGPIPSTRDLNPNFNDEIGLISKGHVIDLRGSTYYNGYFARGHITEADLRFRGDPVNPKGMAALGRSVMLAMIAKPP